MSSYIIGIDPGSKGAIAVLCGGRLSFFDSPMVFQKRGNSKKPTTDIPRLRRIALCLADLQPELVAIEKVWGVKGQGASTGAALGHARGCLEVAFTMVGAPVRLVAPQRWKADLGLFRKPKDAALQLACVLFSTSIDHFTPIRGVRDTEQCIGRADAALIAYHAQEFGAARADD